MDHTGSEAAVQIDADNVAFLNAEKQVYHLKVSGAEVSEVDFPDLEVMQLGAGKAESIFVVGKSADQGWMLAEYKIKGDSGLEFTVGDKKQRTAPVLLPQEDGGARICLLSGQRNKVCYDSDGQQQSTARLKGLPRTAFASAPSIVKPPKIPNVYLLSARDGTLYRSRDGGVGWNRIHKTPGQVSNLVSVQGLFSALCLAHSAGVSCSEDRGLTFFDVGRRFGQSAGTALATSGGRVYAARDGKLYTLRRMTNREMPSSSIYFATGSHKPKQALGAYLNRVAKLMKSDDTLILSGRRAHR